jgi:probable rRNA maturation factor
MSGHSHHFDLESPRRKRYYLAMPVDIMRRGAGRDFPAARLKEVALAILDILGQEDAELSLALIGNAEMRELNAQYRKKDYPTDVLSFPVAGDFGIPVRLLGDVVISVEKAAEQAKERRRSLDEEVVTLLIHGILHLMGYDHERSAKDAGIMGRLEKKVWRRLCELGILKV